MPVVKSRESTESIESRHRSLRAYTVKYKVVPGEPGEGVHMGGGRLESLDQMLKCPMSPMSPISGWALMHPCKMIGLKTR